MKPLSFFTVLLAASEVNAKVTNVPKKDVKCSGIGRAFTPSDVTNAGNGALQHKDKPIGERKYPHVYHFDRSDCGSPSGDSRSFGRSPTVEEILDWLGLRSPLWRKGMNTAVLTPTKRDPATMTFIGATDSGKLLIALHEKE
ncbi:hypothetical protein TrVFT333_007670 [Trichoderma virens FT-333]|nr:hypothetical protein TrVFT333_007670 [Trichoderma virens FT-333]